MSYIPDYRCAENEAYLNNVDKAYVLGYRNAIEDMQSIFDNLNVYECTEDEEKLLIEFSECLKDWMDNEEQMMMLSVFDDADYIPDGVDIKDVNPPLYPSLVKQNERIDK